jgi:hypothetical protein
MKQEECGRGEDKRADRAGRRGREELGSWLGLVDCGSGSGVVGEIPRSVATAAGLVVARAF